MFSICFLRIIKTYFLFFFNFWFPLLLILTTFNLDFFFFHFEMHNMINYTLKSQIVMNRKLKDYTKKKEPRARGAHRRLKEKSRRYMG